MDPSDVMRLDSIQRSMHVRQYLEFEIPKNISNVNANVYNKLQNSTCTLNKTF